MCSSCLLRVRLALLCAALALLAGCSDTPTRPGGGSDLGMRASLVGPVNRLGNQSLRVELRWERPDSASDSTAYDVYLGKEADPAVARTGLRRQYFYSDPLEPNTEYRWKIVARDPDGRSGTSATWRFSTTREDGSIDALPLTVGSRWEGQERFYNSNVRPDSMADQLSDTVVGFAISDIVADSALFGFAHAIQFIHTYADRFSACQDSAYFSQDDEALLHIANGISCTYGVTPLRASAYPRYLINDWGAVSPTSLVDFASGKPGRQRAVELIFEDPPLVSLRYPLELGDQWMFRDPASATGIGWRMDKVVIGFEDVEVSAGVFRCAVVSWLYDTDNDGVWDDDFVRVTEYIADIGLVRRVVAAIDVTVGTYTNPFDGATVDMIAEIELVTYMAGN